MFRMASNLKPEDEGMDDILQTNDDLLRVMDTYKRVVGVEGTGDGASPTQNGGVGGSGVAGVQGDGGSMGKTNEIPEEAGAVGGGNTLAMGGNASTLIDLADMDFGAIPSTTGVDTVTPSNPDSLLDALGTLGKNQHYVIVVHTHLFYFLDFTATGPPVSSQNTVSLNLHEHVYVYL